MSHLSPLLTQSTQLLAERGSGSFLYDQNDRAFLDFTAGIGVTSTGHCHPKVVEAAQAQVGKLIHAQYATVKHSGMLKLADKLAELMPGDINSICFSNAGTEAVETALRLARQATGKANIIAFQGGYHGRTVGAASLTSSATKVRAGYHPMMAGVVFAPFPHAYRYGWSEDEAVDFCLKELDHLFVTQAAPDDTAAMIIEPVQGEYGYYPATKRFMQGLRERCDRHGILLICDEIQAGFGRTGKLWSHSHYDVQPDMVITAKGLASGFPISAVATSEALMAKGLPGSQGGTYGANAVACAAALATIGVIEEEHLVDHAAEMGRYLRQHLDELRETHASIGAINGMGLMQGMEMIDAAGAPNGNLAAALIKSAEQEGLLLLRCGPWGQVVRWLPPLTVSQEEIDQAISAFKKALDQCNA